MNRYIEIRPGTASVAFGKEFDRMEAGIKRGFRSGAMRAKAVLMGNTPVDTGRLRSSWFEDDEGVNNVAPYAAAVEADQHFVEFVLDDVRDAVKDEVTREIESGR